MVLQSELIAEPPRRAAPPGERNRVHVDQPHGGDERRDREHGAAHARALGLSQVEPATEEVGAERKQVVPRAVQHAFVSRSAAEPRLGQHAVEHDERAEDEREPVARRRLERQTTPRPDDERDGHEEEHVLPRRDDGQRGSAHARAPELGHDEVVQRQPHDQDVQRPDRPLEAHAGPIAISVIPVLITCTL